MRFFAPLVVVMVAVGLGLMAAAPGLAVAQEAEAACAQEFEQAEEAYFSADFERAIGLLTTCLDEVAISPEERLQFLRLLAFAYLATEAMADARMAVESVLDVDPTYTPDPATDRPDFVTLVEEVKATREDRAAASDGRSVWRWVAGSALTVAAGIGAAVLLGGGGNGGTGNGNGNGNGDDGLPTPPLPGN
ncbi:MAG: hypothetical protein GVY12_10930 [Bacteroidetes bacterium]|jgi:hypothetical protein|nr:hypothetical protein [Bacteroidota bacterium]